MKLPPSSSSGNMLHIEVAPAAPAAATAQATARRMVSGVRPHYLPSGQVARRLHMSSRTLGKLTGQAYSYTPALKCLLLSINNEHAALSTHRPAFTAQCSALRGHQSTLRFDAQHSSLSAARLILSNQHSDLVLHSCQSSAEAACLHTCIYTLSASLCCSALVFSASA